jgi:hypothetical protein
MKTITYSTKPIVRKSLNELQLEVLTNRTKRGGFQSFFRGGFCFKSLAIFAASVRL